MLEGEISEIKLVERLVELWREQFTGAIRFESDGIIKIVYFKGGDILSASTNDRADSIDEILMKAGKVTREHVKQALAKRKENETLGDALLNLGFITRKELTWARRVQVVGVIRSIAAWANGSFTIVADYLPKRDEGTLFPLPQVLVELIVTEQDRQQFERAMDGGNAIFAKTAGFDDVFRRLGLNEDAEAIAAQIDGTQSASEVATASGRDTFNAYKLLQALATLGVVSRVEKPRAEPQFSLDDFASAGVADAADMWNEPVATAPEPMFQLDEAEALKQPTLEVPLGGATDEMAPMSFEMEAMPATSSAWDEQEEETAAPEPPPVPEPEPMPAWDRPPREPMATPIPAMIEPPAEADEEQWGFDEAQIEAARRASVPVAAAAAAVPVATAKPPRSPKPARVKEGKGSRFGLILALLLLAIVATAGYYGWLWWQKRQAEEAAPVVATRPTPPPPRPVPATTTVEPTTTTIAETTTTTALPTVTAKIPAPAAAPANASKERYDELARQYAANPTGNFTVQVQILCDPSNLGKAIAAGGQDVWFVPQPIGARSCYRVFWGRYATRDEAQRAMASVPAALRDPAAAVKAVPR